MLATQAARSMRILVLGFITHGALASQGDCDPPDFMDRADIPGLGMAEVSGERIEVSVYGYAEAPSRCVTEATVFEAASLTKPLVAYLTMRLVDRGRLDLDDPLIELLPSLPLPPDDTRSRLVTVRMALAHFSGLSGPDDRTLAFAEDPGQTFRYYPAGYRLVQRVVEHLEGDTLEAIAQREVFGPLGMTSSSLVFREDLLGRIAARHRMLGEPIVRSRDPARPANAAASLVTTPGDYARFLRATLRGDGLTPASRDVMLTPQVEVGETDGAVAWGLGWGLEPERGTFFHYGDDGAAKSFTIGSASADRAVVYFANSFYGMAVAGEIAERVVPGASPGVDWLGYGAWDDPERLARHASIVAFVEGDADQGMATFERFGREHPELDMDTMASFLQWVLDGRDKHEGRARILAWQLARQPGNASLSMEIARSLRSAGDDDGAMEALEAGIPNAQGQMADLLANRLRWIRDERAAADPSRGSPPVPAGTLAGTYGERDVRLEDGELWYQRTDRPRYRLNWMHGTTYALEGVDSFRIRFEIEGGRAAKITGLYEGGQTDESLRGDPTD